MKKLALLAAGLPAFVSANVELDTQQVTADRIVESQISNSLIISRDDIEKSQASNLNEVLLALPGFQFTQQGGNANTQSFSLNGFRSDNILILLNGQRFGSATLGTTTFNTVPADIIQRIEIVSNARSAIYGADALGGVINIVTVPAANAKNSVQLAVGNQRTNQLSTNLNANLGDLSINFSGFSEKTHGFDVQDDDESDSDGSERHTAVLGAQYNISKQQSLAANFSANRGSVDYDGRSNERDFQQQAASVSWQYAGEDFGAKVQAGQSSDKSWNYGNGTSRADADGYITENKTLESTLRYAVTEQHSLLVVGDYREEDISQSDSEYDKKKGDVTGFGVSHRFTNTTFGTEIGIRRDDSTRFEENYSYSLSTEFIASQQLSITAAVNTGFKAPSFNDLYYPFVDYGEWGTYQGNTEVGPEKSLNRRIAVQYDNGASIIETSYQYSHIEDKIDWQDIGGGTNTPVNLDKVLIRSASASWKQFWSDAFNTQLSYDWTHAIDLESGKLLQRQAPRNIKASANYSANGINFGSLVNYLSESYDDDANTTTLAAYAVVDVFTSYDVSDNFQLGARINNALNREYQTADGYPASERTYLIDGTFKF
jgi:vitamin B12 transporter